MVSNLVYFNAPPTLVYFAYYKIYFMIFLFEPNFINVGNDENDLWGVA